jgi:hypothetical protein
MAGNKIQLKRTSVPGRLPSNTDIDVGELAINFADNRLFTKDGSNAVIDVHGQSLNTTASVQFANVTATTITGNLNWSYIQSKPDLKIDITGDATGNNTFTSLANGSISVTLANTAVTPGSYGNSSSIPVITVDSKGRITAATTNAVAGVTGFTYTSSNSTLVITTGAGTTFPATITTGNSSVQGLLQVVDSVTNTSVSVAASANSVKRAYDLAVTANTAAGQAYTNAVAYAASNTYVNTTFAPLANPSLTGVVTVSGNLIVTGSTTYVNTNIFQVSDNIITLNADVTGTPTENVGFEVNRGSSPYTYLIWDESIDKWTFTNDGTTYFNIASNTDVNTAYSNAVTTAASDATTKAATAYTNAVAYAAANTYVNTQLNLKANLTGAAFTGPVSGITTLAAGNTTITGTLSVSGNVTGSAANVTIVAGAFTTTFANTGVTTFPGAVSGITTLAAGNTSITGFANVSSTLQVGANVILGTTTISANGGVGTVGQVLTSGAAGNVYWSTVATGGFANGQSISVANLVVTNIATLNAISANGGLGTAGQVLTTNGSNVYWSTVTSGGGSSNSFGTFIVAGQANAIATSSNAAITFVAGNNVTITTDAATNAITFVSNNTLFTLATVSNTSSANISLTGTGLTANTVKVIGAGGVNVNSNGSVITIDGSGVAGGSGYGNSFGTFIVAGQANVIATSSNAAITFVAGSGMSIATDNTGKTITLTSSSSGTGTGTAFIAARDNFTANGTQTAFTLSLNATANSILVAVDGLIQFHNEDYDVSGTTLTFSPAPANNELIEVLHISGATNYLFQQYAAIDSFSGNGSNTLYTLTRSANTKTAQVYLDGLLQDPNNDYTFSNTTLTFTTAPLTSEAVLVYHTESSAGNPQLTSISGVDTFAGDGTTTAFTLTGSANTSTSFITVNGLVQRYTTDYTLSGTTLTFVDAPPNGSAIQGWRLTGSLGVTYKTIRVSGQSDIVANQADDILSFANGAGLVITTNATTDTLTIARAAITKQSLAGNGSNTIFTLSTSTTEDDILVHVDGLYFHPTDDYTVSGTTITFTAAPINSAEIRIRYMR